MVTREGRAPIRQYAYQPAGRYMGSNLVLGQIRQSETGESGVQPHKYVVEHELPFDMDVQVTTVLLEFPRIKASMSRETQIDAVVPGEIPRRLRVPSSLKILR